MSRFFLHPTPAFPMETLQNNRKVYNIFFEFGKVLGDCTAYQLKEKKGVPEFLKSSLNSKSLQFYFKIRNNLRNSQFIYHNLNKIAVYIFVLKVLIVMVNIFDEVEKGGLPGNVEIVSSTCTRYFSRRL